jgi:ABC-type uncharacterized transport system ATPase subunit
VRERAALCWLHHLSPNPIATRKQPSGFACLDFQRRHDNTTRISGAGLLISGAGTQSAPAWFPDGRLLAYACQGSPQLLLADEPTGNLDREATFGLLELLTTLQSEMGLTLVVATHDPLVASQAGRVLHLRDGRARGPVPGLDSPAGQK